MFNEEIEPYVYRGEYNKTTLSFWTKSGMPIGFVEFETWQEFRTFMYLLNEQYDNERRRNNLPGYIKNEWGD